MGLFNWFKSKELKHVLPYEKFPELHLLFPSGKEDMISYWKSEKELLHCKDDVAFQRCYIEITRNLFFDSSLEEDVLAIKKRILSFKFYTFSETEANTLACRILEKVKSVSPELKMSYVDKVMSNTLKDFGIELPKPSLFPRKSLPDTAFADLITNRLSFFVFKTDDNFDTKNIYGYIQDSQIKIVEQRSINILALYSCLWIASLSQKNYEFYIKLMNDVLPQIKYPDAARMEEIVRAYMPGVEWNGNESILQDLYTLIRGYKRFINKCLVLNENKITTLLASTQKQIANVEVSMEEINAKYPPTSQLSVEDNYSTLDYAYIMLRDMVNSVPLK